MCGCAELTSQLIKIGFDGIGVDYKGNKDRPRAPTINADLATQHGRSTVSELLRDPRVQYVSFAPPCGTASRARERKLKVAASNKGWKVPVPLRSDAKPEGLETLDEEDWQRVHTANVIYCFIAEVIKDLDARGVQWTIENPTNSIMWLTKWLVDLRSAVEVKMVTFQHCMQCLVPSPG